MESKSYPVNGNPSLIIRPVRPEDGPALYEIVKHSDVASTLLQLPSNEYQETDRWIKNHNAGHHRLVAVKDGQPIGSVSLVRQQRPRRIHSGELGIMVHPSYWKSCVGSALMKAILNLADNWLNLKRIELDVYTDNATVIRLYERFGFEVEGAKSLFSFGDGHWSDAHFMARYQP